MVQKPRLAHYPKIDVEGLGDSPEGMDFEAKVRYLASSLIVTIPVRVARELNLELGDKVQVKLAKLDSKQALSLQNNVSSG